MSYQRSPHPLSRFYSISEYYVYGTGTSIDDGNASYSHNPSFCELIGDMIQCETGDSAYAAKVTRILAKKLGCENQLRYRGYGISYRTFRYEDKIYGKMLDEIPKLFDLIICISNFIDQYELNPEIAEDCAIKYLAYIHAKPLNTNKY